MEYSYITQRVNEISVKAESACTEIDHIMDLFLDRLDDAVVRPEGFKERRIADEVLDLRLAYSSIYEDLLSIQHQTQLFVERYSNIKTR